MGDTHTISMDSSILNWDQVDNYSKNKGFKNRSQFVQYCIEKQIYKTKLKDRDIFGVLTLIGMGVIILLLTVI